jgi:hypothetical protein
VQIRMLSGDGKEREGEKRLAGWTPSVSEMRGAGERLAIGPDHAFN